MTLLHVTGARLGEKIVDAGSSGNDLPRYRSYRWKGCLSFGQYGWVQFDTENWALGVVP